MEMQALTSRVAPVGGNYYLADCSTSLPAFSQRGKFSFLDQPLFLIIPFPVSSISTFPSSGLLLQTLFFFFFSREKISAYLFSFSFSLLYPTGLQTIANLTAHFKTDRVHWQVNTPCVFKERNHSAVLGSLPVCFQQLAGSVLPGQAVAFSSSHLGLHSLVIALISCIRSQFSRVQKMVTARG